MKNFLFILVLFFTFTNCTKEETKMAKDLWKKGGQWTIREYSHTIKDVASNEFILEKECKNCGTFSFRKDLTATLSMSFDGEPHNVAYRYTSATNELELTTLSDTLYYEMSSAQDNTLILSRFIQEGGTDLQETFTLLKK